LLGWQSTASLFSQGTPALPASPFRTDAPALPAGTVIPDGGVVVKKDGGRDGRWGPPL